MSVCIVSFSTRKGGNCAQIGAFLRSLLPDAALFDLSELELHPCGRCAYECFSPGGVCPYLGDAEYTLLDAITHSERAYFVVPNYCDYPNAAFFAFNERSQCYFQGRPELLDAYENVPKRIIAVSNTNEENFRAVMAYQSHEPPEMLFLSAKKFGKVSVRGNLLSSPEARAAIEAFALGGKE